MGTFGHTLIPALFLPPPTIPDFSVLFSSPSVDTPGTSRTQRAMSSLLSEGRGRSGAGEKEFEEGIWEYKT